MRFPRGAAVAYWYSHIVEVCESDDKWLGYVRVAMRRDEGVLYPAFPIVRLVPLTPLARDLLAVAREGRR